MSKFDAAIFDLDGVIADTARSHFLAWKRLADRLGLPFDLETNERLKGVPRMASLDIILEGSKTPYTAEAKQALAAEKNAHYVEIISNLTPNDILPGAREAIERIRRRGLKTALASASKNAVYLIECLQITDILDYVADANFVQQHKPDPEIFLNAAYGLNVIPQKCIAFEDAISGVAAIKSAGMYAVGIGHPETLSAADIVVPSLGDFDDASLA